MIKVALQGVEFFAYHGFYPEEQLIGTRFLIDIEVSFVQLANLSEDNISHTVNYETLYAIVSQEMLEPKKLLETVGQNIIDRIKAAFDFIKRAEVTIKKLNPPFKGPIANSAVTISYQN